MTPEQLARQNIDQMLSGSGWDVQNSADMNITASLGVAVREFPLKTGSADYGLYINGKVAGVIEAKKEVPKTLIFAKTDLHADDIVKIVREEFGRGNEFCQKITSKSHVSGKALVSQTGIGAPLGKSFPSLCQIAYLVVQKKPFPCLMLVS